MKECFSSFCKLQPAGNGFKDMFVKALQQGNPFQKTFSKIKLTTHSLLSNCRNLLADSGFKSKFINNFGGNKG